MWGQGFTSMFVGLKVYPGPQGQQRCALKRLIPDAQWKATIRKTAWDNDNLFISLTA